MADISETQNQNFQSDALNFAIPEQGYGVYLKGILPEDQRVLAGAFSISMQQIRNISQIQLEKFAQVAYNNENMFGLNLVNGTDVPTDVRLARVAQGVCAIGGGVHGTFTFSNFYGAMSGLPYPLREIFNGIQTLQTENLKQIYQNLYLAVKWEPAGVATVDYTNDGLGNYTFAGISYSEGGGYCREGASAPSISVAGATGNLVVGTDPDDLTTYGKIIGNTFTASGTTTSPTFFITIPDPPTTYGSSGWSPGMNTAIQHYIDAANQEILDISVSSPSNFELSNLLNTNWNVLGKALRQEQRARYISESPVPIPRDKFLAIYPVTQYVFVDAIPALAANTLPHMYAQTLEHISDLNFAGGQSIIALMRESRNQERLNRAGIELDNNLANDMTDQDKEQLLANGTLPGAIGDEGINGYTIPVYSDLAVPTNYYDPCLPGLQSYNQLQYVNKDPTSAILSAVAIPEPVPIEDLPETPFGYEPPPGAPTVLPSGSNVPVPDQSFPCEGDRVEPIYGEKPAPIATSLIGVGEAQPLNPPENYPIGVNQPTDIIPVNLDIDLASSTLIPTSPRDGGGNGFPNEVQQAIDKVIACNCDCWVA